MSDNDQNNDSSYLDKYVGEGKRYRDVSAALKALEDKDKHILQIENENSGMRDDLSKRETVEEAIARLLSANASNREEPSVQNASGNQNNNENHQEHQNRQVDDKLIETLLDKKLKEVNARTRQEMNIAKVKSTLSEKIGPEYSIKLKEVGEKYGMDQEALGKFAAASPDALIALVETISAPQKKEEPFKAPTKPSVNSAALFQPSEHRDANFKPRSHYTKMRRENPVEYWKPRTQIEITRMAETYGDDFINS